MKGDFSRDTGAHGRARKYSRLYMQQGRVAVDADWHEQVDRERELTRIAVRDAIGHCGVPRESPGFGVTAGGAGGITLGAGRMYVNGVLVENDVDTPIAEQPFGTDELTTLADGQEALVYLEVRERHVTALDDERLREKALGGPDTMTRVQTEWRVRVVAIDDLEVSADDIVDAVAARQQLGLALWAPTTGLLEARASVAAVDAEGRPCALPPTAGYSDQLNSLYRVEIHVAGDETTARYKWSRRNGSVRGLLHESGGVRTLIGTEANELIASGSWVEVRTPEEQRTGRPGQLSQITIEPDETVSFDGNVPGNAVLDGAMVTLWDHPQGADAAGIAVHTAAGLLESGVEVEFQSGSYAVGEYWLIPARTATADIEWPPVADGPTAVRPLSHGPWFCPLALAARSGDSASGIVDLRIEFPPLTAIRADDVSYDGSTVDIDGATTVQEALERLTTRSSGSCTFHAAPGLGWESVFDQIGEGRDGDVCLEVGEYLLKDVLEVADKGHVVVTGRGRGTHIIAPSTEAAVQFVRCAGVTVRDLRITAGTAPGLKWRPGRGGALGCRDCGPVRIESVHARNRGARPRSSACISVTRIARDASQSLGRGDVVVRDCTMEAGLQQIGLNVVNARRVQITGNTVFPEPFESSHVWATISTTKELLRDMADLLVAYRRPTRDEEESPDDDLRLTQLWSEHVFELDEFSVTAIAHPEIASGLDTYLTAAGPAGVQAPGDLSTHLRNRLKEAIGRGGTVDALPRERGADRVDFDIMTDWLDDVRDSLPAHMSQGIVVGGDAAELIEIRDNEVTDAIQGVHVGLSHAGQSASDRDIARRVVIAGNTIDVAVLPFSRARHGIFCGNARSLLCHDNFVSRHLTTPRLRPLPINGIHVHGFAGVFMSAKNNDVRGCAIGIRFVPDPVTHNAPLWLIEDNLLFNASVAIDVPVAADLAALVRRSENNLTG